MPTSLPNIVLLYADDLGWKDLGAYGNELYRTPHLDALAAEGVLFTNAYANGPNCAPSRASLLTGTYTPRHGVFTVAKSTRGESKDRKLLVPENPRAIEPSTWTLAEALSSSGYRCASIGKWNVGGDPLEHGFDVNVAGSKSGAVRSYFSPHGNDRLSDGPEGEHLPARLTREALTFIDEAGDQPFFLYLPYFSVHTPLEGRADLVAQYEASWGAGSDGVPKPVYAAMVEALDESVGAILAHLETRGLTENTIVIFSSDNGGHGKHTSNAPLRGSKGMLYEGGIRVPWIVRWPARFAGGRTSDEVVIGVDIFPTLLEAVGRKPPRSAQLDGVSLLACLTSDEPLDREAVFWHFPAYLQPYGEDMEWRATPAAAVRSGDLKLIEYFEDGRLELYDLGRDIGECNDLAADRPAKRDELQALLREWRKDVNAVVPSELNPEYEPNAQAATGQEPVELKLWAAGTPGAPEVVPAEVVRDRPDGGDRHVSEVHVPTITAYLPQDDEDARPAVVVCPGGGYSLLALDKEGHDVARWFAQSGVVGVVLKYRLPRPTGHVYGHEAPLSDARRALELVRERAQEWKVDPERVGIMGFSAGGHLAASAAVQLGDAGPNFSVLVYPVVSMLDDVMHAGSRNNLLGKQPSEELVRRFSSELAVRETTPPAFLVHTSDDPVKAENSLRYYSALRRAGVPAELHVFARGGHGYGMRSPDLPVGAWPDLLLAWMKNQGLITKEG